MLKRHALVNDFLSMATGTHPTAQEATSSISKTGRPHTIEFSGDNRERLRQT
ncbi:hypothetical protein NOC27_30 [Nitrosococcus oceani AFC27]|uniref:hypothetical protein n=1 Tax=Nitrosococcus oceani TaxID=1229 RepID=UPI000183C742|nr:hypothetical protein [Nitrosococcus oceani]EDZ66703.1 hypothetical protein NOC27_30 [Nitrosococcus oceani AFC27]